MFVLVDLDPDGIAILSTYKYGSYRLAHEDITLMKTPALSLPNIHWLGVKSQDLIQSTEGGDTMELNAMPQLQGLMRLTTRDRKKATRMLEWDLCVENGPEQSWRQELQKMLMLNIKAEMQAMDELMPGGLVSWLSNKLWCATERLMVSAPIGSSGSDDGMLF